jgi:transcriptional regulator of arginine metabolism
MQSRLERHQRILDLIEGSSIDTQESLKKALSRSGFAVNQATLSRDIRELGLIKVDDAGEFRYVSRQSVPTSAQAPGVTALANMARFVRDIDDSGNIIVVKTDNGAASYVAEAIDKLSMREILGTVAGDNTLIIVVKSGIKATTVKQKLRAQLK